MRASRAQSQIDKIIYPKCTIKKEHSKQSLNLVCLTKTCKFSGVICALCKSKDHVNHHVVPFKLFIQNVNLALLQKQLPKINEQQKIKNQNEIVKQKESWQKKLEQTYIQMMSLFQIQIVQLAKQVQECEQRLIKRYELAKSQLSEQMNKKQILNDLILKLSQLNFEDQLQYRHNVSKLNKLILVNSKNQITIKKEDNQIINKFIQQGQKFKENIYLFQRQLSDLLEIIDSKPITQKIQGNKLVRPQTAITSLNKNHNLTFSTVYKPLNIVLQKQNKIAKLKDNLGPKIVCFTDIIAGKVEQAKIKILSLGPTSSILIGVCLRQKVKLKGFKFQKSAIGHGCYVVSSNNLKYSNSDQKQNTLPGFNLSVNQQISILVDNMKNKILFKKKNDDKSNLQMSLKLKDSQLKELSFCVVLSNSSDKVQII